MKKKELLTLALLVAILPPAWAVASPYFGIKVGPIALIAAGIYDSSTSLWSLGLQVGISMLVGVYYVGALMDKLQRVICGTGEAK